MVVVEERDEREEEVAQQHVRFGTVREMMKDFVFAFLFEKEEVGWKEMRYSYWDGITRTAAIFVWQGGVL